MSDSYQRRLNHLNEIAADVADDSRLAEERAVAAEKIRIVFATSPGAMLYSAVAATAVTLFLLVRTAHGQELWRIGVWASVMLVLHVYPYSLAVNFETGGDHMVETMNRQLSKFNFWAGWLLGSCWGATSWLFVSPADMERNVLLIVVNAVILMGYTSVAGLHRRHFLSFVIPLVAVFLSGLIWLAIPFYYLLAFFVAMFAMGIVDMSRTQSESVTRSIQFGIEKQALLARAESANRAKTRFLASASHDLRQPIHTLALFVEALCLRPLDDATRTLVGHMRTATQTLSSQLDALLDISKLDAQIVQVNPSVVALHDLLTRITDEYRPAAQRKGLVLNLSCDVHARVRADALHLERITRNLIDNAIKYTEAGSVDVSAERHAHQWTLRIRDTGCGIAPSDQARVFEEFFQVGNPHRDRTLGLGLGLSIVARLADLLGIKLDMQSQPGQGTTFSLHLPSADQEVVASEVGQVEHASLDGCKVLVIDDEQSVRLAMQSLLESLGCSVQQASGIEEALAGGSRPDIALVDFRLAGGEDGISTIERLRQRHPALPAVLISGDVAPERLRQAHEAGLVLLHKPVPLDKLVRAIHANRPRG